MMYFSYLILLRLGNKALMLVSTIRIVVTINNEYIMSLNLLEYLFLIVSDGKYFLPWNCIHHIEVSVGHLP